MILLLIFFRIAANLKGVVYFAGIRHGTKEDWDFLWKKHETTLVATEKKKIEFALTDSKDPKILKRSALYLGIFSTDKYQRLVILSSIYHV